MIEGTVVQGVDATIPIEVVGASGKFEVIRVIIDTGFTGALTLPQDRIAELSLALSGACRAIVADGRSVESLVYRAVDRVDDKQIEIRAVAVPGAPVVGMELFRGFHIAIDVVPDGIVRISQIES